MDISDVTSEIMEQVQVYASAYSLMGGRFDHGDKRELVDEERAILRSMVLSALENANDDCRRTNELTNAAIDDYNTVLARLKRAEELLKPFAAHKTADGVDGTGFLRIPDHHPVLFNGLGDECTVCATVGDVRAAARFLESKDAE